jgi:hypothetical protein
MGGTHRTIAVAFDVGGPTPVEIEEGEWYGPGAP